MNQQEKRLKPHRVRVSARAMDMIANGRKTVWVMYLRRGVDITRGQLVAFTRGERRQLAAITDTHVAMSVRDLLPLLDTEAWMKTDDLRREHPGKSPMALLCEMFPSEKAETHGLIAITFRLIPALTPPAELSAPAFTP